MGYSTDFSIEFSKFDESDFQAGDVDRIRNALKLIPGGYGELFIQELPYYDELEQQGIPFDCVEVSDSSRWYDHEIDMKEVAKELPEFLITVHGAGEEFGDYWIHYLHGDEDSMCYGAVVFEAPTTALPLGR